MLEEEVTVVGEMAEMEVAVEAERGIAAAVEEAEEEKMAEEEVEEETQVAMVASPLKERRTQQNCWAQAPVIPFQHQHHTGVFLP